MRDEFQSEQTERLEREAKAELVREVRVQAARMRYLTLRRTQRAELEAKRQQALEALRRIERSEDVPFSVKKVLRLIGEDAMSMSARRRQKATTGLKQLTQLIETA